MSFDTWHDYGYGIRTDNIVCFEDTNKMQAMIDLAPEYSKWMTELFDENDITKPTLDDYFEADEDCHYGLATILQNVIREAEDIFLEACDDFDGKVYLIYEPAYPWSHLTESEKKLTPEKLDEIFKKYISMISDREIKPDYQEVENGG